VRREGIRTIELSTKILIAFAAAWLAGLGALAGFEYLGMMNAPPGPVLLGPALLVAVIVAVLNRTTQADDFYNARRRLPGALAGVAAGSQIAGFCVIALVGLLYNSSSTGLAFVIGWSGGFVLLGVMFAPYLRKAGNCSLPGFFATRFSSTFLRVLVAGVMTVCGFLMLLAMLRGVGVLGARFFGLSPTDAIKLASGFVVLCLVLGGSRSFGWAQAILAVVAVVAFLVPVIAASVMKTGSPLPQLAYGELMMDIVDLERNLALRGLSGTAGQAISTAASGGFSAATFFALIVSTAAGTACAPYIVSRSFTVASVDDARFGASWAVLFVFVLAITAPAYSVFAKAEFFQNLFGASADQLPSWVAAYGKLGMVRLCGSDAQSAAAVTRACSELGAPDGLLRITDLQMTSDLIYVAFSDIMGLGTTVSGLAAAGGIAAMLLAAGGALMAVSQALAHDFYYRTMFPDISNAHRLLVTRLVLIVVAVVAAGSAFRISVNLINLFSLAFSLAAAAFFPALSLAIWWRRFSYLGALAAIIAGTLSTLAYFSATGYGAEPALFGIDGIASGLFGLIGGFAAGIVVSLLVPDTDGVNETFVDQIRVPDGEAVADIRRREQRQKRDAGQVGDVV